MRKVITQLKRGAGLIEVMTHEGMLDTAEHPGMLVMIKRATGPVPHFHCFAFWRLAWQTFFDVRAEPVPDHVSDAVFAESLQTPWGILGLLSSDNQPWLYPTERHQPFLYAVLSAWDELYAVGPRYFVVGQGERLWQIHNNLHYVLANMGVPDDVLGAPLPAGGPRALLRYARAQS